MVTQSARLPAAAGPSTFAGTPGRYCELPGDTPCEKIGTAQAITSEHFRIRPPYSRGTVAAAGIPQRQTIMARCRATTKKGSQCKRKAAPGSRYCGRHERSGAKRPGRASTSDGVYQAQVRQWLKVLRVAQWFFTILGAGFAIVSVCVLAMFLSERRAARASSEWPSVEGRILSSELDFWQERNRDTGRSTTVYVANVEYGYRVNGKRHMSRRVAFGGRGSTASAKGYDKSAVQAVVERYPTGKAVDVYHDPHDPAQAVLEPGMTRFRRRAWIFPVVFLVLGLGVAFGARPFFRRQMRSSVASMGDQFGPNIWETAAEYGIYPPAKARKATAQPARTGFERAGVVPYAVGFAAAVFGMCMAAHTQEMGFFLTFGMGGLVFNGIGWALGLRRRPWMLAPFVLGCLAPIVAGSCLAWLQHHKLTTYEPAPATIMSARVERGTVGVSNIRHRVHVTYEYHVAERRYTSSQAFPLPYFISAPARSGENASRGAARHVLETVCGKLPAEVSEVNERVPAATPAYHDPTNPSDAFLVRRCSRVPFPLFLLPLLPILALRFWSVTTASRLEDNARERARRRTLLFWHCAGAAALGCYLLTDASLYRAGDKTWVVATICVFEALGLIPAAMLLPSLFSEDRAARAKNALGMWAVLTGLLSFLAVFVVHLVVKLGKWIFRLKIAFWPLYGYVVLAIGGAVTAVVAYAWWREEHDEAPPKNTKKKRGRAKREMTPIEREREIRRRIDEMGAEAFPDQPRVTWTIKGFEHREDYSFVEVEPTRETAGWSRLKFVVHFHRGKKLKLAGCYAFSDGLWGCVFTMSGHDEAELDRLHCQGTGEPMPTEEREAWIQRNIQAVGKQGWPEDDVTWTLRGIAHKGPYSFVEAEASPADVVGWSRLKFVVLMQAGHPTVVGCYGLDENGWGLVFEGAADTPSDWKQLHDSSD